MSDNSRSHHTRPILLFPFIPLYVFSFLSALTMSFTRWSGHSARAPLLSAGFLFAATAVVLFARFLLAADESLKAINYLALVFGFLSSLTLALVLDFLRVLGFHVPVIPTFGIPVSMITLWTLGLVLAAAWQRANEGHQE